MVNSKAFDTMLFLYLSFVFLLPCDVLGFGYVPVSNSNPRSCNITSIYQLGDSLSDTGNLIIESPNGVAFARLPYGESFFKHPTGRCSDGLLMIDFMAKALNIPLLTPYLNRDALFNHGVNFAVAGATALPVEFLADKNIVNPLTNSSLSVQLDWMWSHFNSICYDGQDCAAKLKCALFIVGAIGSHDYYYAFSQGKRMEDVNNMVIDVVKAIIEGIIRVIQIGGTKIIVPGSFPLGQFPAYLTARQANNSTTLRKRSLLNNLSLYHNDELKKRLQMLKRDYKNITIIYVDYHNAFNRLMENAPRFGFNGASDLRKPCCGVGGRFSFNPSRMCGAAGVPVCTNPDGYVMWDGFNLTQKAYRILARWLFRSIVSLLSKSS
ncbi:acetylajmalan esterase isoform X1 [Beta vulgaris subsp. vulgaris]|uniref:acetylajmalan esterase isoform X1 n=1 Tax=Beta vulgaris subsp. vulgaris TaxID=3555 RepID=UPI0025488BED|nr:acetylajmalan esterase isoform X1 [Beta vulgaris subsp. vulgaris]